MDDQDNLRYLHFSQLLSTPKDVGMTTLSIIAIGCLNIMVENGRHPYDIKTVTDAILDKADCNQGGCLG